MKTILVVYVVSRENSRSSDPDNSDTKELNGCSEPSKEIKEAEMGTGGLASSSLEQWAAFPLEKHDNG